MTTILLNDTPRALNARLAAALLLILLAAALLPLAASRTTSPAAAPDTASPVCVWTAMGDVAFCD